MIVENRAIGRALAVSSKYQAQSLVLTLGAVYHLAAAAAGSTCNHAAE